jgi:hypothetical protein
MRKERLNNQASCLWWLIETVQVHSFPISGNRRIPASPQFLIPKLPGKEVMIIGEI